jgi:hypothetical protein
LGLLIGVESYRLAVGSPPVLYSPRFDFLLAEPGDVRYGDWSREQLQEMDALFVARVEAAFEAGLESRAAAKATVQVGRASAVDVERAIEAAWAWFQSVDQDVAFSAVVAFVRVRCPNVAVECIRAGFEKRFARRRHAG